MKQREVYHAIKKQVHMKLNDLGRHIIAPWADEGQKLISL